nr:DUF998 domain-containing protein [Bacteroidota bacterium]
MLINISILSISALSSIIIPFIIYHRVRDIHFDPRKETLSFMSNRSLFGKKMSEGFTEVLFVTGILTFAFFWLMIRKLGFANDHKIWEWLIISTISTILLAFAHHNIIPFRIRNIYPNIIRIIHNILAVIVFISLPILILWFDRFLLPDKKLIAIAGIFIIGATIMATVISIIVKKKLTGITEISFVIGISVWNIATGIAVIIY